MVSARKTKTGKQSFLICGDNSLIIELSSLFENSNVSIYIWNETKPNIGKKKNVSYSRTLSKIPRNIIAAFELTNINGDLKIERLINIEKHCSEKTIIITSAVTQTVTELSMYLKYPQRLIGIGGLPSLLRNQLVELSAGALTHTRIIDTAVKLFLDLKKETAIVDDRVGMVMPRILCCLINEATFALQDEIASSEDIDAAMKLGTNYPLGPMEWGKRVGFPQVLAAMEALQRDTGEDRYRPSPLLRKLASVGELS